MKKILKSKLNLLDKRLKSIRAKDIMTKNVITTSPDALLADVAERMIKDRISGLPVVDGKKKVVGLITVKDLFIVMDMIKLGDAVENGFKAITNPTVKFAMSTEVIRANKNMYLNEVIAIVSSRNVYTLPVFEKEKLVGVIGRRDVFKAFYSAIKGL